MCAFSNFYTIAKLKMEYVGNLPAPDCSLPSRRFSLFGILATSEDAARENETCHFCLTDINRNERMVTETPCCGHLVHSACFEEWLFVSASDNDNYSTLCVLIVEGTTLTWVSVISTMHGLKATRCKRVKAIQRKEDTNFQDKCDFQRL